MGKGRLAWSSNDGIDLARKKGTRCFKIGRKVRRGLCERANEEENAKKTIWMVCRKLSAQIRCSDITSQDSGELDSALEETVPYAMKVCCPCALPQEPSIVDLYESSRHFLSTYVVGTSCVPSG